MGSIPVHPAQSRVLDAGRIRGAAHPAGSEPSGNRDRVALEEDRARAEQTKSDTEFLARELAAVRLAVGDTVTRDYLRKELDDLIDELTERLRERTEETDPLDEPKTDDHDPTVD